MNDATSSSLPAWWNDRYDSAWVRVKAALLRDLEQTRRDLGSHRDHELRQGAGDTILQALGREPIPPSGIPNAPDPEAWEAGLRYGYGAGLSDRYQSHGAWTEHLECDLRDDWDRMKSGQSWDAVRERVRDGFEHARTQVMSHV